MDLSTFAPAVRILLLAAFMRLVTMGYLTPQQASEATKLIMDLLAGGVPLAYAVWAAWKARRAARIAAAAAVLPPGGNISVNDPTLSAAAAKAAPNMAASNKINAGAIASLVAICLTAALLAGCVTRAQPPGAGLGAAVGATIGTTPVVRTKVDETIAKSAQLLADQCMLIRTGLTVAPLLIKSAKAQAIVAKVRAGVASFCDGPPPSDVPTALATLAKLYVDLTAASPELKAYMDERSVPI